MRSLKQYLVREARSKKKYDEFFSTLGDLDIEVDGPDSVGNVYIYPSDANDTEAGVAPCILLGYAYGDESFITYDDETDDYITLVTKISRNGKETTKKINVKGKFDLTDDGKEYKLTKHNAELLASILVNKDLK